MSEVYGCKRPTSNLIQPVTMLPYHCINVPY